MSYLLVTWFETFGCVLIMLGLVARTNAFGMFVTLAVAWAGRGTQAERLRAIVLILLR